jgi:4'-phosphopantetheinyl transferase EntD
MVIVNALNSTKSCVPKAFSKAVKFASRSLDSASLEMLPLKSEAILAARRAKEMNYHAVFPNRQRDDVFVLRPVSRWKIQSMNSLMTGCGQFPRQTARQLRVHNEFHAATGSMFLMRLKRAA